MKLNMPHFFKHDGERFEKYLEDVESGKRQISGATLMPHELLGTATGLFRDTIWEPILGSPNIKDMRKRLAETQLRTIELQWKALVEHLRGSGSLENALAICDVSASMGTIHEEYDRRNVQPIFPAVSLSLVLAQLAKPPFANCFITFSTRPHFVALDPSQTLHQLIDTMVSSDWNMNTDFDAVFLDLLLPLAIKHKVKQEDMIKRIFVFSDMQFDYARCNSRTRKVATWETNHMTIQRVWREAGYELPEIVYWDLAAGKGTMPVLRDQPGVALVSGFSQAMMKVFLGENEEQETVDEAGWEAVEPEPVRMEAEEFNPINVMKKAVMKKSFDGLVVLD